MTERLYYTDSYLRQFRARVTDRTSGGRTVYLDRTAFYPTSGGQPHDTGSIAGAAVLDVVDEGERIAHHTERAVEADDVDCAVDWPRRFDHMQQHSGQHLLSAVFIEQFGIETCSFHLGEDVSTLDLETPAIDMEKVAAAERRANEVVWENRPIAVNYENAVSAGDLRKPSDRAGTLRIVSIHNLDRIACGGTHVRLTGEIGPILIRRLEKVRNTVRVEFLCGMRAVRRARADYNALSRIAQTFSAGIDETPVLAAAQVEAAREADRVCRKLNADLARYQGRELYDAAAPDSAGVRRVLRRLPKGALEDLRALAQSFTAQPKAVFIGAIDQPPSVLMAASADAGLDAGKTLQPLLAQAGGRGGGNARMAQGGAPTKEALETVLAALPQQS
ncbi:MAG TPA: alanyl-tRNA editing protein [Bryobacteraceae bacterium]|nr:alanyl-tRNA editing protein [Bryobacteraceae bacterium]